MAMCRAYSDNEEKLESAWEPTANKDWLFMHRNWIFKHIRRSIRQGCTIGGRLPLWDWRKEIFNLWDVMGKWGKWKWLWVMPGGAWIPAIAGHSWLLRLYYFAPQLRLFWGV